MKADEADVLRNHPGGSGRDLLLVRVGDAPLMTPTLKAADYAKRDERRRVLEIITKYRGQAAEVKDPQERERLLLVLGLLRSEVENGG